MQENLFMWALLKRFRTALNDPLNSLFKDGNRHLIGWKIVKFLNKAEKKNEWNHPPIATTSPFTYHIAMDTSRTTTITGCHTLLQ